MATSNLSAQQLAQQIEKLVEDFIAGGRGAATAALDRAFGRAVPKRRSEGPGRRTGREMASKRAPSELDELAERLYEAIRAKPGEAMTVLAPIVGSTPRALQLPAKKLKAAGRIRSVGQRSLARYFPMVKTAGSRSS